MNLALFDFDNTITDRDTWTPFLRFAVRPSRLAIGQAVLAPVVVGYRVGVVTASTARQMAACVGFRGEPPSRLRGLGADYDLICSELEIVHGKLTGRYVYGDCVAAEKARRVQARYDLTRYDRVYAYGDSEDDREMLALAHERYFGWRRID